MIPFSINAGQAQIFVDDELVEKSTNITRRWHRLKKHPANPLIVRSGPEAVVFLFGTVMREPDPVTGGVDVFRMWYYAGGSGRIGSDRHERWYGYATSRDGIVWTKPELGLYEFNGNTANNVCFYSDNYELLGLGGVLKDPNPDVPADERYKTVCAVWERATHEKQYLVSVSPDGIRWKEKCAFVPQEPAYPDRCCLVWDPYQERYCHYGRSKYRTDDLVARGGEAYFGRAVTLLTSPDGFEYSPPINIFQADEDDPDGTEMYGASVFPYAGQWLSLVQIHRSLIDHAHIDMAIAHSRDGENWTRERTFVLPNGDVGEWDRFNQCTANAPVRVGDELWIYYSGRTYRHGEYKKSGLTDSGPQHSAIGLATIRVDGWCSLEASFDGGELTTKPVVLPEGAETIKLNAKADWGEVVVEILNEDGDVLSSSAPVRGDGIEMMTVWPEGPGPGAFAGKPARLRFTAKNALLYSWTAE